MEPNSIQTETSGDHPVIIPTVLPEVKSETKFYFQTQVEVNHFFTQPPVEEAQQKIFRVGEFLLRLNRTRDGMHVLDLIAEHPGFTVSQQVAKACIDTMAARVPFEKKLTTQLEFLKTKSNLPELLSAFKKSCDCVLFSSKKDNFKEFINKLKENLNKKNGLKIAALYLEAYINLLYCNTEDYHRLIFSPDAPGKKSFIIPPKRLVIPVTTPARVKKKKAAIITKPIEESKTEIPPEKTEMTSLDFSVYQKALDPQTEDELTGLEFSLFDDPKKINQMIEFIHTQPIGQNNDFALILLHSHFLIKLSKINSGKSLISMIPAEMKSTFLLNKMLEIDTEKTTQTAFTNLRPDVLKTKWKKSVTTLNTVLREYPTLKKKLVEPFTHPLKVDTTLENLLTIFKKDKVHPAIINLVLREYCLIFSKGELELLAVPIPIIPSPIKATPKSSKPKVESASTPSSESKLPVDVLTDEEKKPTSLPNKDTFKNGTTLQEFGHKFLNKNMIEKLILFFNEILSLEAQIYIGGSMHVHWLFERYNLSPTFTPNDLDIRINCSHLVSIEEKIYELAKHFIHSETPMLPHIPFTTLSGKIDDFPCNITLERNGYIKTKDIIIVTDCYSKVSQDGVLTFNPENFPELIQDLELKRFRVRDALIKSDDDKHRLLTPKSVLMRLLKSTYTTAKSDLKHDEESLKKIYHIEWATKLFINISPMYLELERLFTWANKEIQAARMMDAKSGTSENEKSLMKNFQTDGIGGLTPFLKAYVKTNFPTIKNKKLNKIAERLLKVIFEQEHPHLLFKPVGAKFEIDLILDRLLNNNLTTTYIISGEFNPASFWSSSSSSASVSPANVSALSVITP